MARGKNAPALFEVIRNAQEKQRQEDQRRQDQRAREQAATASTAAKPAGAAPAASPATLLKSPLFWFKGRAAHDEVHGAPARQPIEPVMRDVPQSVEMPKTSVTPVSSPMPLRVDAVVAERVPEHVPEPVMAPAAPAYRPAIAELARQVREEIAAQDIPAAEPFFDARRAGVLERSVVLSDPAAVEDDRNVAKHAEFAIDHEHRQISLRLSYSNAIIAGFALFVACGLAYVIGSAGRAKAPALADSALHPNVLNVVPSGNAIATNTTAKPSTPDERAAIPPMPNDVSLNNDGRPIEVPMNVKRIVGYQYLVLMSFQRSADATALVKFLADNGVAATSEKALPGYAASWYSVVSTRGFDHTSKNAQYDVFVASLTKLMQKYSRNSQYVAGKPAVYAWRSAN